MKIFHFENITKKRLIVQFAFIFVIPYLFIILSGLLSEVWDEVYFHAHIVIIIAVLLVFIQITLFIKTYLVYKKISFFQSQDLNK